jgi:nucleoside-diphosphate-sugar epimerase
MRDPAQRHLGTADQTMFRKLFESVIAGHVRVLVGRKSARLENSYVHNLIHGFILAAEHLVPDGTAHLDNYFSIAKASRDLGYQPRFNTGQALAECLPYCV